jgi:hypothetical protein
MAPDCQYYGEDKRALYLYWVWATYVRDGGTPLTDLPVWMADVVHLVGYYRGLGEHQKLRDAEERKKQRDMLKQAGLIQ